jgi:hypothetical protein
LYEVNSTICQVFQGILLVVVFSSHRFYPSLGDLSQGILLLCGLFLVILSTKWMGIWEKLVVSNPRVCSACSSSSFRQSVRSGQTLEVVPHQESKEMIGKEKTWHVSLSDRFIFAILFYGLWRKGKTKSKIWRYEEVKEKIESKI